MSEDHKTQFDAYRVRYLTGSGANPEIDCLLKGTLVGKLLFHEDDGRLPVNQVVREADEGVVLHLHFDVSRFPHLIDLLREEKPLFLSLSESSLVGAVMTRSEPVGEGEPYLSR